MAMTVNKMAPSVITIAAVGYCCFPYLNQPDVRPATPSKETSKAHEIPLELLSPNVGAAQARDPFDLKAKMEKDARNGTVAKKEGAEALNPESPVAIAAREAAAKKAAAEKAAKELREALDGLELNGTYVSSRQRVAVINSQLYGEGQTVRPMKANVKSFVVSEITQHKVMLKLEAQTAELSYHNPPVKKDKKKDAPASQQVLAPVHAPL